MFNIDDTPNIFRHNFDSSVFKSNNTNDNDDNIEIPSNIYITIWNISLVNGFIIFNVLVNLYFKINTKRAIYLSIHH